MNLFSNQTTSYRIHWTISHSKKNINMQPSKKAFLPKNVKFGKLSFFRKFLLTAYLQAVLKIVIDFFKKNLIFPPMSHGNEVKEDDQVLISLQRKFLTSEVAFKPPPLQIPLGSHMLKCWYNRSPRDASLLNQKYLLHGVTSDG